MDDTYENISTMPTIDRLNYGDGWAKGYKGGQVVISFDGVSDINAIELFDDDGNRVIPVQAEPPITEIRTVKILEADTAQAGAWVLKSWPLSPPMRINPYCRLEIAAVENLTDISVTATASLLTLSAKVEYTGRWIISANVLLDAAP